MKIKIYPKNGVFKNTIQTINTHDIKYHAPLLEASSHQLICLFASFQEDVFIAEGYDENGEIWLPRINDLQKDVIDYIIEMSDSETRQFIVDNFHMFFSQQIEDELLGNIIAEQYKYIEYINNVLLFAKWYIKVSKFLAIVNDTDVTIDIESIPTHIVKNGEEISVNNIAYKNTFELFNQF